MFDKFDYLIWTVSIEKDCSMNKLASNDDIIPMQTFIGFYHE